jgi:hypothetical protein
MRLLTRFPSLSAWIMTLALTAAVTLAAVRGVGMLEPSIPPHLDHMHGEIVAMRDGGQFAVEAPGQASGHGKLIWLRVARGAHISLTHVQRHLREHAPTDVYYETSAPGVLLAWVAD